MSKYSKVGIKYKGSKVKRYYNAIVTSFYIVPVRIIRAEQIVIVFWEKIYYLHALNSPFFNSPMAEKNEVHET